MAVAIRVPLLRPRLVWKVRTLTGLCDSLPGQMTHATSRCEPGVEAELASGAENLLAVVAQLTRWRSAAGLDVQGRRRGWLPGGFRS